MAGCMGDKHRLHELRSGDTGRLMKSSNNTTPECEILETRRNSKKEGWCTEKTL